MALVALWAAAQLLDLGAWRSTIVLHPPFRRVEGEAWEPVGKTFHAPLHRLFEFPGDTPDRPQASDLSVQTPEGALGPAHASPEEVAALGRGRYSFFYRELRFSTLSGADPNSFSAGISVTSHVALRPVVARTLGAMAILGAVILAARAGIVRGSAAALTLAKRGAEPLRRLSLPPRRLFAAWTRRAAGFRAGPAALGFRELCVLFGIAAGLATVTLLLVFPGLYTTDSLTQLKAAFSLLTAPSLHDTLIPLWFPPMMHWAMAAVLGPTGEVWPFAWLQYFLFLLSLLLLLTGLLGGVPRAVTGLCVLLPLPSVWGLFPYVEATIWNAIGLNLVLAGTLLASVRDRIARLALLGLTVLGLFVLFTFRYNALPLAVPAALLIALVWPAGRRKSLICLALAIAVGTAATLQNLGAVRDVAERALPPQVASRYLPQVYAHSQLPTILLWEIVGTMKVLGDDATEAYAVPGIGDFREAVRRHNWLWQGSLILGEHAPIDEGKLDDAAGALEDDWIRIVRDHPAAYLEMKWHIWRLLLGLGKLWTNKEMLRDPLEPSVDLPNSLRPALTPPDWASVRIGRRLVDWNRHIDELPSLSWLYLRWLVMAAGAGGAIVLWRAYRRPGALLVWLGGMLSYSTFFLLTPSTVFRYFFPAHVCLLAVVAAAAIMGASSGWRALIRATRGIGVTRPE